jgi:SsrA-binding protein
VTGGYDAPRMSPPGKGKADAEGLQVIATNRKARHEYEILEVVEAGLALTGTEVKSLRAGNCNMTDAYAAPLGDELFLKNLDIAEYSHGNRQNHDPRRPRALLLHKREIRKLTESTRERGFTLVPLRLYFKGGWAKVEIAVARGRKLHDKRESKAKREAEREMARARGRRRPR